MLSNIELDVFDVRLLSSFWNLIIIQNAFRIIIWRERFLWLCFPLLLVQHYHAHSQLSGLIENSVLISNYSRVTCRHFIPIPVIILCWPSWPVPGVSIYISIVSASPTAWRHESVAWYQLGPHETRNNLCWLQPVPKQQLCRYQPSPGPGSSDLCQCDVTSWGRLCSWPQWSGGRGQFWEQQLGGAQPADAAWAGVRRNTRLSRQLRLAQTLPPQHFVPDCYWFLQNRVILPLMDSSSRSWRTSFKDVPSLSHHWSSETVFIERWDGKDAVQLISVCSLTRFFGKTFADTFILLKRRKE